MFLECYFFENPWLKVIVTDFDGLRRGSFSAFEAIDAPLIAWFEKVVNFY